jgi:hypothetical protein
MDFNHRRPALLSVTEASMATGAFSLPEILKRV